MEQIFVLEYIGANEYKRIDWSDNGDADWFTTALDNVIEIM